MRGLSVFGKMCLKSINGEYHKNNFLRDPNALYFRPRNLFTGNDPNKFTNQNVV